MTTDATAVSYGADARSGSREAIVPLGRFLFALIFLLTFSCPPVGCATELTLKLYGTRSALKLGPPYSPNPNWLLLPKPADSALSSAWHLPQNCRYSFLPVAKSTVAGAAVGLAFAIERVAATAETANAIATTTQEIWRGLTGTTTR